MEQQELPGLDKINTKPALLEYIKILLTNYPQCSELSNIYKDLTQLKKTQVSTLEAFKKDISKTISDCITQAGSTKLLGKTQPIPSTVNPGGGAAAVYVQPVHGSDSGSAALSSLIPHPQIQKDPTIFKPVIGKWFDEEFPNKDDSSLYKEESDSESEDYMSDPGSTASSGSGFLDYLNLAKGELRSGTILGKPRSAKRPNRPEPLPPHMSDAYPIDLGLDPSAWEYLSEELAAQNASSRNNNRREDMEEWKPKFGDRRDDDDDGDYDNDDADDDARKSRIEELKRELWGLGANACNSINRELKMFASDATLFEEKGRRPAFHCSHSPPTYLKSAHERARYADVMERLWREGEHDKTTYNVDGSRVKQFIKYRKGCKLHPTFLQMKLDKSTQINLSTLEQFVLLCILIWGDCMHDSRRIHDGQLKKRVQEYIVLNIDSIIATFYPNPQLIPAEIKLLRDAIENHADNMETFFVTFVENSELLQGTPPAKVLFEEKPWPDDSNLSNYLNTRLLFNNASCLPDPIPNLMDSLAGQIDAGQTGGDCALEALQDLTFMYKGEDGTKCTILLTKDIVKSKVKDVNGTDIWFYATDIGCAIWVTTKYGRRIHTASFERVPLCTLSGDPIPVTLELRAVASKVWEHCLVNSTGKPNGFSDLTKWSAKWVGDAGQQELAVFNGKGLNGGRLPLLVSCDAGKTYTINGKSQTLDPAICGAYNVAVCNYNIGRPITQQDEHLIESISEMLKYKTLVQNDRSAHAFFHSLMILLLNSNCSIPRLDQPRGGRTVVSPYVVINVDAQSFLTCSGRSLIQLVPSKAEGLPPTILKWTMTEQKKEKFPSGSGLPPGAASGSESVAGSVAGSVCSTSTNFSVLTNSSMINELSRIFDAAVVQRTALKAQAQDGSKRPMFTIPETSPESHNTQATQDLLDSYQTPNGYSSEGSIGSERPYMRLNSGDSTVTKRLLDYVDDDDDDDGGAYMGHNTGGTRKKSVKKRTVKRRRTNNRKTQQYSNKKKHSSNKKKSVITKKTNVSKSKRNNKRKTKRRMNH